MPKRGFRLEASPDAKSMYRCSACSFHSLDDVNPMTNHIINVHRGQALINGDVVFTTNELTRGFTRWIRANKRPWICARCSKECRQGITAAKHSTSDPCPERKSKSSGGDVVSRQDGYSNSRGERYSGRHNISNASSSRDDGGKFVFDRNFGDRLGPSTSTGLGRSSLSSSFKRSITAAADDEDSAEATFNPEIGEKKFSKRRKNSANAPLKESLSSFFHKSLAARETTSSTHINGQAGDNPSSNRRISSDPALMPIMRDLVDEEGIFQNLPDYPNDNLNEVNCEVQVHVDMPDTSESGIRIVDEFSDDDARGSVANVHTSTIHMPHFVEERTVEYFEETLPNSQSFDRFPANSYSFAHPQANRRMISGPQQIPSSKIGTSMQSASAQNHSRMCSEGFDCVSYRILENFGVRREQTSNSEILRRLDIFDKRFDNLEKNFNNLEKYLKAIINRQQ